MSRLDCDAYAHGNVEAKEALEYVQTLKEVGGRGREGGRREEGVGAMVRKDKSVVNFCGVNLRFSPSLPPSLPPNRPGASPLSTTASSRRNEL